MDQFWEVIRPLYDTCSGNQCWRDQANIMGSDGSDGSVVYSGVRLIYVSQVQARLYDPPGAIHMRIVAEIGTSVLEAMRYLNTGKKHLTRLPAIWY